MASYLLKRLLLIIPTLFGIMLISFVIIQFAPGGPVERIIAQLTGHDTTIVSRIGGGGARRWRAGAQSQLGQGAADVVTSKYRGAQGLDPEFIKSLEKQFGFDKPAYVRFFIMMKSYLTFDFGKSYFRDISVLQLIKEKLPVSISLGLWMMLLTYLISIPLGIRKAVHDGEPFDKWSSTVLVVAYAIPGFLFAVLLLILFAGSSFFQWFPSRGLTSDNWDQLSTVGKVVDYFWHLTLPLIAMALTSFTTMTFLTKNSFLDEIRKQYVMTARAKGLSEGQVLYGHVFRNAMLLIIAGFPGAFITAFFAGAMLIETIFSLDGLGPVVLRVDREARLSRRLRHAVDLLADGARGQPRLGLRLHPRRPAHRLREPGGLSLDIRALETPLPQSQPPPEEEAPPPSWLPRGLRWRDRFHVSPHQPAPLANFKANRRGYWSLIVFLCAVRSHALRRVHRQRSPDRHELQGRNSLAGARRLSGIEVRRLSRRHRLQGSGDPRRDRGERLGDLAADRLLLRHDQQGLSGPQGARGLCLGYPAPPPWASNAPLCEAPPEQLARFHAIGNYNWLGLDNQGRDVVARVIYGFRISVLFGLILTVLSPVLGRDGRRRAGLFRRPHRSHLPALPRDLVVGAVAVRADHHLVGAGAGLLDAARHAAHVRVGEPRRRRARRVPARAQLRVHHGGARARAVAPQDHVEAHAAQRDGGDADVPAVPAVGQHRRADGARLPRARPAARLAVAGRAAARRASGTSRRRGSASPASSPSRSCCRC